MNMAGSSCHVGTEKASKAVEVRMKALKRPPRLMIMNVHDEDAAQLVRRHLRVAKKRLGVGVQTVWCNPADLGVLERSLQGIKVVTTTYCPPGYFQLGQEGEEKDDGGARDAPGDDQRS
jgi:hypothetical protein